MSTPNFNANFFTKIVSNFPCKYQNAHNWNSTAVKCIILKQVSIPAELFINNWFFNFFLIQINSQQKISSNKIKMPPKKSNNNNNNKKQIQKKSQKPRPRESQGEIPAESSSKARGSLGRTTDMEPNIPEGMLNFVI